MWAQSPGQGAAVLVLPRPGRSRVSWGSSGSLWSGFCRVSAYPQSRKQLGLFLDPRYPCCSDRHKQALSLLRRSLRLEHKVPHLVTRSPWDFRTGACVPGTCAFIRSEKTFLLTQDHLGSRLALTGLLSEAVPTPPSQPEAVKSLPCCLQPASTELRACVLTCNLDRAGLSDGTRVSPAASHGATW